MNKIRPFFAYHSAVVKDSSNYILMATSLRTNTIDCCTEGSPFCAY